MEIGDELRFFQNGEVWLFNDFLTYLFIYFLKKAYPLQFYGTEGNVVKYLLFDEYIENLGKASLQIVSAVLQWH